MNLKSVDKLKNPSNVPAIELLGCVDDLTNGQCYVWEYDTIFEVLKKEYDITLPPQAADRLMAITAASINPSFLWDFTIFQCLVQSLNFDEAVTDTVVQCSPGECMAAIKELEVLGQSIGEDYSRSMYNDDSRIYVAGCCLASGLVCLPEYLSFCDEELDRMLPVSSRLSLEEKTKVRLQAKKEIMVEPKDMDSDNPLEVMVRKIQEAQLYLSHHHKLVTASNFTLRGYYLDVGGL
jgi:hypothetical protein